MSAKVIAEQPEWQFDFGDCSDPKAAAGAFIKRIGGTGIEGDGGRYMEISACVDADLPGKVLVWAHAADRASKEILGDADEVVWQEYRNCRHLFGAKGKSRRRSSARQRKRRLRKG